MPFNEENQHLKGVCLPEIGPFFQVDHFLILVVHGGTISMNILIPFTDPISFDPQLPSQPSTWQTMVCRSATKNARPTGKPRGP